MGMFENSVLNEKVYIECIMRNYIISHWTLGEFYINNII